MFSSLTQAGSLLLGLSLFSSVYAAVIPSHDSHVHDHASQALPDRWYHHDEHPVHALFRRQAAVAPDSAAFPQVGSAAWTAAYPAGVPDSNAMPQAWKDALNNAVQAGKIPNIPPSVLTPQAALPTYANLNPISAQVCSGSYGCRIAGQIWDAPPGVLGIGFDDGPLPSSDNLYTFLQQNQVKATHFFIGVNIVRNWEEFNTAFQTNQDDIAVHTWTHPHMTTLSNADVVAQLGWTLQVIYDSTGGRLARFWRPPFGDVDARVTAIAKEVFGLTTIVWNRDTRDWTLGAPGGTTPQAIQGNFQNWLSGPQTLGLVILEHELSAASVQAFIAAFPLMKQFNWALRSVAQLDGRGPYQNAKDATSPPTLVPLTAGGDGGAGLTSSTTSTSSTPTTTSTTSPRSATVLSASASALADSKKSGAAATLYLPRLTTLSLPALLALLFSRYLI